MNDIDELMNSIYDSCEDTIIEQTTYIERDIHDKLDIGEYNLKEMNLIKFKIIYDEEIREVVNKLNEYLIEYIDMTGLYSNKSIRESIIHYMNIMINNMVNIDVDIKINYILNKHIVEELRLIPLPLQRSKEWYYMRTTMLTASSLADALGVGHFNTRNQVLLGKCFGKNDQISNFAKGIMQHGVKYEDVAVKIYEKRNNVQIVDFGLLPHPTLKCFGASPDGIVGSGNVEYMGRMLEVKVPPKREIQDMVPRHYWMQVQGQLEVCNLEKADFLQVKIVEYNNTDSYLEDNYIEEGEIVDGKTLLGFEKGCVITYKENELDENVKYLYSELYLSLIHI